MILQDVDSGVKSGYHRFVDEFIPQRALQKALSDKLDLTVTQEIIPTGPFEFKCLIPPERVMRAFRQALADGHPWPPGMPLSVVTYNAAKDEWKIMDGMMRICAAKDAGFPEIEALVASGETFDALESVLRNGYYGEDFVEMLAMVSPMVLANLELRDQNRMSGK